MDAQGALDSLVGRLTTILVNEAQLLGGLRGDVEFIKDEMESMNSLLLHLTEAQHRNHQVRTWMKHVVGLARDCEGNVKLYVRYVAGADPRANKGFLGYMRRFLQLLQTMPARHRVATWIRELKVRARDVGERRLRYGVTMPLVADEDDAVFMEDFQTPGEEEDVGRRAMLDGLNDDDAFVKKGVGEMIKLLLSEEAAPAAQAQALRVLHMTYPSFQRSEKWTELEFRNINTGEIVLLDRITRGVYEHPSVVASFSCKALVCLSAMEVEDAFYTSCQIQLLQKILQELAPLLPAEHGVTVCTEAEQSKETSGDIDQLIKTLGEYLKGKRFLIILYDVSSGLRDVISYYMLRVAAHGSPGSALVITTGSGYEKKSTYRTFEPESLYRSFCNIANELIGVSETKYIETILAILCPDVLAMKMFVQLLCANPRRGATQMDNFVKILRDCKRSYKSLAKQMVRLSYNYLPAKFRSCLLYLTVFPEGDPIRRTTLCRRWIAEGLIATRENRAEDEAGVCLDALLSWGLIQPGEVSGTGKVKSCTLHHTVRQVISRIARDVNFVDTDLALDLTAIPSPFPSPVNSV